MVLMYFFGDLFSVGVVVGSVEEELLLILCLFCRVLGNCFGFLIKCFLVSSWRRFFGYEDFLVFVKEIVCMVILFYLNLCCCD